MNAKRRGTGRRGWVFVCYAVAAAVGVAAFTQLQGPVWQRLLLADIAATLAVFGFSVAFSNSSFYDPYWSVAPPVICGYWLLSSDGGDPVRGAVVCGLVLAWSMRLTWNWWRGWGGVKHEDWRYVDLREKTGRGYWLVSLTGLHLGPTLWVFAGCLALWPAVPSGRPFGALDMLAAVVTGGGIALEAIADQQLRVWTMHKKRPGNCFSDGVWGWMRHPNYLGEILFWTGLYLFAVATDPTFYVAAAGPVAMILLFVFISIPLKDKHMLETRREYDLRMKEVWAFLPKRPVRPE